MNSEKNITVEKEKSLLLQGTFVVLRRVYCLAYPLLLLALSLFRGSFLASLYAILGITALYLYPHPLLTFRKKAVIWILGAGIAISTVSLVLESIFFCVILSKPGLIDSPRGEFVTWQVFGFAWENVTWIEIVQMSVPDLVAWMVSLQLFVWIRRYGAFRVFGTVASYARRKRHESFVFSSSLHSYTAFTGTLIAGLAFPSVPTLCILALAVAAGIAVAFKNPITKIMHRTWYLMLALSGVSIYLLVIVQVLPMPSSDTYDMSFIRLPEWMYGQYSLESTDLKNAWKIWPVVLELFGLLLMFAMSAYWRRMYLCRNYIDNNLVNKRSGLVMSPNFDVTEHSGGHAGVKYNVENGNLTVRKERYRTTMQFLRRHGWKAAYFAFAVAVLLTPGILSWIQLLIVFTCNRYVSDQLVSLTQPLMLLYSSILILAFALYQIPFGWPQSAVLGNLGFTEYQPSSLYLFFQCIPVIFLAAHMNRKSSLRKRNGNTEETQSLLEEERKKEREEENNDDNDGDSSSEDENDDDAVNFQGKAAGEEKKKAVSLKRLPYHILLRLWAVISVAFTVVLANALYLSLAGLYMCGLQSISVINAGYMAFFMLFMLYEMLARKLWGVLILYTELVILLITVWQVSWTEPWEGHWSDVVGLEHYSLSSNSIFASDDPYGIPGLALIRGAWWHLSILTFAVLQQILFDRIQKGSILEKYSIFSGLAALDQSYKYIRLLTTLAITLFHTWGLILCYFAFFLTSVLTPTSVFSAFYLLVAMVCFLLHQISAHSKRMIRNFWPGVLFVCFMIFSMVYLFQFEDIQNLVNDIWAIPDDVFSPADLGLVVYSNHRLYYYLLGNAVSFVLSVFQMWAFLHMEKQRKDSRMELMDQNEGSSEDEMEAETFADSMDSANRKTVFQTNVAEKSTEFPWLAAGVKFVKRFLMLNAVIICMLTIFVVCVSNVSLVHFSLSVVVVICLYIPNGTAALGFPLLLVVELIMIMQYAVQFPGLHDILSKTYIAEWIGLTKVDSLFWALIGYAAVCVSILLQHFAMVWETARKRRLGDSPPRIKLIAYKKEDSEHMLAGIAQIFCETINDFWVNNCYVLFLGSLAVNIFLRNNIFSFAQLLVVFALVFFPSELFRPSLMFFVSVGLSTTLLFQYMMLLRLPHQSSSSQIGSDVDPDIQHFFAIGHFSSWELIADFVSLLLSTLIVRLLLGGNRIRKTKDLLGRTEERPEIDKQLEELLHAGEDMLSTRNLSLEGTNVPSDLLSKEVLLGSLEGDEGEGSAAEERGQSSGHHSAHERGDSMAPLPLTGHVQKGTEEEEDTDGSPDRRREDGSRVGVFVSPDIPPRTHRELKHMSGGPFDLDELQDAAVPDSFDSDEMEHQWALNRSKRGIQRDFTKKPRSWSAWSLWIFYRFSAATVLFAILCCSTAQENLLYLGYFGISVFLLLNAGFRPQYWWVLRLYSCFVLLLRVCYQLPWIKVSAHPEDFEYFIGLYKITLSSAFNPLLSTSILYDIVIFILLLAQEMIFRQPEFALMRGFRKQSYMRAKERAEASYAAHNKKLEQTKDEYLRSMEVRFARLEQIRTFRRKKGYLMTPSVSEMEKDEPIDLGRSSAENYSRRRLSTIYHVPSDMRDEEEDPDPGFETFVEQMLVGDDGRTHAVDDAYPDLVTTVHGDEREHEQGAMDEEAADHAMSFDPSRSLSEERGQEEDVDVPPIDLLPEDALDSQRHDRGSSQEANNGEEAPSGPQQPRSVPMHVKVKFLLCSVWSKFWTLIRNGLYWCAGQEPPESDVGLQQLFEGVHQILIVHSASFVYLSFILNAVLHGTVLSIIPPIITFAVALIEYPAPARFFWHTMLLAISVTIGVKMAFQFSIFCVCSSESWSYWCFQFMSDCNAQNTGLAVSLRDLPEFIGIDKTSGWFFWAEVTNFLMLLALLWNRYNQRKSGCWLFLDDLREEERKKFFECRAKKAKQEKDQPQKSKQMNDEVLFGEDSLDREEEVEDSPPPPAMARKQSVSSPHLNIPDEGVPDTHFELRGLASNPHIRVISDPLTALIRFLRIFPSEVLFYLTRIHMIGKQERIYGAEPESYYGRMVTAEIFGFLWTIINESDFTGTGNAGWKLFLVESSIPQAVFWVLLIQFLVIVLDRFIFLYKSLRAKLLLQYATLIGYHVYLMFLLPRSSQRPFISSWTLIVFYLFKCAYWWASASQIRVGYPVEKHNRWLTAKPSILRTILFMFYRAFPYGFELHSVIDWMVEDTTLRLFEWLTVEDIYAEVFLIKCKRRRELRRKFFKPRPPALKWCFGGCILIFLLGLLWFPLFILSTANPTNVPNTVQAIHTTIDIQGWQPFYETDLDQGIGHSVSSSLFDQIRPYFGLTSSQEELTQVIPIPRASTSLWQQTPPARERLKQALESQMTLYLEMRIDFVRKYPDDQQTISQEWTVTITQDQKNDFLAMLDTNSTQSSVLFPHVFGQYYRLPMTGNPIIPEATSTEERLLPIQLSLNRELATEELVVNNTKTQVENVVEFWEFKSPQPNVWSNQNPVLGADVVVTSTLVPTGPLSGLATAGIIGLYIGVVLAIGKVLRSAVSDLQYNIMWKELPSTCLP
eukprot:TRINITY_DN10087_c0_g1_i4.p1 TRINITY_DN10087_c0_g1~~TRINITY_DN10087_c0_g1_i4.p1  ORF type:complete len:2583 (-),score=393.64 TRINITY_DN10087_c0_g1_i4:82-7830(-)